jgi:hypothetical protein
MYTSVCMYVCMYLNLGIPLFSLQGGKMQCLVRMRRKVDPLLNTDLLACEHHKFSTYILNFCHF